MRRSTAGILLAARLGGPRSPGRLAPVLLLLLLPVVFVGTPAVAGAPTRDGWTFGAGLGPGLGGESDGIAYGGGASLRALYVFNRWFGLGVESNVWAPNLTVGNYRTSVMTAAASCYPFGEPFILRLGVGLGTHERRYYANGGPELRTYSYSGLGATAGTGLEFKIGSRWSVGPQLDLSIADADGLNGYANATIQINWYPGSKP